jgi:DNA-binding LacI/PurR family transcriptional regulator
MPRQQHGRESHSVTSHDVATAAGVSQSTVSRVLNKKAAGFISTSTRNRVLKTARELGYVPNPMARALRRGKTNLVGIVLREVDDPVFALLSSHLSVEMRRLGYHLILINAQSDPREALEMKDLLDARHADGLIIIGDLLNGQDELQQVVSQSRAVVSLFRKPFPGIGPVVTVDNDKGVALGLHHLLRLGHRQIGFLGYEWLDDTELRQAAFQRLMKSSGCVVLPQWIQMGQGGVEGGYRTARIVLAARDRPTAIVACDDLTAIGAIRAAEELGLDVPRDISVIGFDDIHLARYFKPSLTTVRMPVKEISSKVCSLLVDFMTGSRSPRTELFRIQPKLIVRGSTAERSTGPRARARPVRRSSSASQDPPGDLL